MRKLITVIEGVPEMTTFGGGADIPVTCQNISKITNCTKRIKVFDELLTTLHGIIDLLLIRPS
jgi:hypothetical protein